VYSPPTIDAYLDIFNEIVKQTPRHFAFTNQRCRKTEVYFKSDSREVIEDGQYIDVSEKLSTCIANVYGGKFPDGPFTTLQVRDIDIGRVTGYTECEYRSYIVALAKEINRLPQMFMVRNWPAHNKNPRCNFTLFIRSELLIYDAVTDMHRLL